MTTRPHSHPPAHFSLWVTVAFIYVYLAWGCTYMALHFALQSMPPFVLSGMRFFIAGSVLLALVAIFQRRDFRLGTLQEWRDALIVGTMLLVGGFGSLAWGQQFVNTSTAALIFGSLPLWIILFDWIRPGGTVPSVRTCIGLALGFLGLCILIKPSSSAPDTRMELYGKLALVFSACSWSAGAIYSRYVHATGSPLLPMARQMLMGGVVLTLIAAARHDFSRTDLAGITMVSWLGFGYLVVFGSILGFTAYLWLMRVSTPARVATISYVNLVIAVLLGWTLGGEPMTVRLALGAGIILSSVVLVLTKKPVVAPTDA